MLTQTVFRENTSLLAEHPVNHVCQGFIAQDLTCLGNQRVVERIAEWQRQQTFDMGTQAVLHRRVARVPQEQVAGHPLLQPCCVTAILDVQHQIRTQAIEQAFAVFQVGVNLTFQQRCDTRQQVRCEFTVVGIP
ncbi:hypothetical protein D3C87_1589350 [compost metagenome]